MRGEIIYLDNAASTRLDERVLEAMKPYYLEVYAVATSEFGYSLGIEARDALDKARETLAGALGASADEVIFTSGGAESSNLALKGVAAALGEKKLHLPSEREAERLTGLQAGGISPLALINRGFQVVIDESARRLEHIYVSGGQRGLNIRLAPADLAALTNARFAAISRVSG